MELGQACGEGVVAVLLNPQDCTKHLHWGIGGEDFAGVTHVRGHPVFFLFRLEAGDGFIRTH